MENNTSIADKCLDLKLADVNVELQRFILEASLSSLRDVRNMLTPKQKAWMFLVLSYDHEVYEAFEAEGIYKIMWEFCSFNIFSRLPCDKLKCLNKSSKTCGKCDNQRYCSRECQKDDWSEHKLTCSA